MIIASLVLLFASCAKEQGSDPGDGESSFRIVPQVSSYASSQEQAAVSSRAIVEGTAFKSADEVGYIILGSAGSYRNEGVPHLGGYGNVRAQAVGTGDWMYFIFYNQYLGQTLTGFTSYGNVDIYGYHPYDQAVDENDLNAIPYSLGTVSGTEVVTTGAMVEKDYMYATPVLNYAMLPGQSAQMTFNHIMTCLEFRVRKMFAGPALTLSTIDFTITGTNGRVFHVTGDFDAADGTVRRDPSTVTRILVDYSKTLGNTSTSQPTTTYMSCSLMLPSLECSGVGDDATITAVFHFVDQDGGQWEFRDGANTTYSFNLSDVVDPVVPTDYGLRAGKRYQVTVDVSNFVKYSGMPTVVYPDWDNNKEDSDPNVI